MTPSSRQSDTCATYHLNGPKRLVLPSVPEQPTNLQGEATSPNEIRLVWDAPQDSGNNIRSYELYYNSSHRHRQTHVSLSPSRTTHTMHDLTPNTVYHILVAAMSSRGEGASTPIIQVRTLEYSEYGIPNAIYFFFFPTSKLNIVVSTPAKLRPIPVHRI